MKIISSTSLATRALLLAAALAGNGVVALRLQNSEGGSLQFEAVGMETSGSENLGEELTEDGAEVVKGPNEELRRALEQLQAKKRERSGKFSRRAVAKEEGTEVLAERHATTRAWKTNCKSKWVDYPSSHDQGQTVVVSAKHKFAYVENYKAASSSIRKLFRKSLHVSPERTDLNHTLKRPLNTLRYGKQDMEPLFRFSFVRDPVSKFESGYREIRDQETRQHKWNNMTVDQVMESIITRKNGWWNQHISPSSYNLSPFLANKVPLELDFVGKTEQMTEDWAIVVSNLKNLDEKMTQTLLEIGMRNTHHEDPDSKLSPAALKKMCESEMFKDEWDCFGYEKPDVCK